MSGDYRFELVDVHSLQELERTSALLRLVFPRAHHLTARYLDWQYARNPDGDSVGCNAYFGSELVGHMAAMPMVGKVEGEAQRGLFMLNGAIHPDHRRRRLQSHISAAIFEEAVQRGYHFCFGTGNRYSTGPLLTRFKMVKPLEARIGFGVPRRNSETPLPSFERVWSEAGLRWRLANPERRYTIAVRSGALHVLATAGPPATDVILYSGTNPADLEAAGSPKPVRIWVGLDPSIDWRRSRFITIPSRLRPSPLNLVYKDLTGGGFVPDPERVLFQALDFDPY